MRGNCYTDQGIILNPSVPLSGSDVTICYNGLLAQSGATTIIAHVGSGDTWDHIGDFNMKKTASGFEAHVPVAYASSLNVCFKDGANNWDNNNGLNYKFCVDC